MVLVDTFELEQAHIYILYKSTKVVAYVNQHLVNVRLLYANKSRREQWIQNEHTYTFISWFMNQILKELSNPNNTMSKTLRWLSERPNMHVFRYSSYTVNGYQFYTTIKDMRSIVQNSGITLVVQALHVSSAKDKNHVYADMSYYRIVDDIWEVDYKDFMVVMLKWQWVDKNINKKVDENGFTLVIYTRKVTVTIRSFWHIKKNKCFTSKICATQIGVLFSHINKV